MRQHAVARLIPGVLICLTVVAGPALAQVAGTVTSSQPGNPPVAHARVHVVDLDLEAVTNAVGHYELAVPPGEHSVRFTKAGFEQAVVLQTVTSGQTSVLNRQLTFVGEVWDAGYDFQGIENPSGDWTYGYIDSNWTFVPYTVCADPSPTQPLRQWQVAQAPGNPAGYTGGFALKSWSGSEIQEQEGHLPPLTQSWPQTLAMNPGYSDDMATMRWTAPRAMNAVLHVRFSGLANASTDCHVFKNLYQVFAGEVSGFAGTLANNYSDASGSSPVVEKWMIMPVLAGDRLDFAVDNGGNGWENDLTGLVATIEPSATGPGNVSGYVRAADTGQAIEGATVSTTDGRFSTITDFYGYYLLVVPSGNVTLRALKTPYPSIEKSVVVPDGGDASCDFALTSAEPIASSIAELKNLPVGTYVSVTGTATCSGAAFTDGFFVEDPNRIAGVKIVNGSGSAGVLEGETVTVEGYLSGIPGQLYIQADTVQRQAGTILRPVGTVNRSTKATSGLLGRVWGNVTAVDAAEAPAYFYLDDGSNLADGTGNAGLRIDISKLASPETLTALLVTLRSQTGNPVAVTGIVSNETIDGQAVLTIRPRSSDDVRTAW